MKQLFQLSCCLILISILAACGTTKEVGDIKEHHAKGHFLKAATTEITCKDSDEGCNQLHLVKGDSCYRLAKDGMKPERFFDCAIKHLDKGIALTKKWKIGDLDLKRDQQYENLCESLRERQDMSKGAEAENYTKQLLKTAEAFSSASPGNLAAIYFTNSAKFTLLRVPILTSPDNPQVCSAVNDILSSLNSVSAEAANSKYAAQFTVLTGDVKGIKPSLTNCP